MCEPPRRSVVFTAMAASTTMLAKKSDSLPMIFEDMEVFAVHGIQWCLSEWRKNRANNHKRHSLNVFLQKLPPAPLWSPALTMHSLPRSSTLMVRLSVRYLQASLQASLYPLMMEVGWIFCLTSSSAFFKSSAAIITTEVVPSPTSWSCKIEGDSIGVRWTNLFPFWRKSLYGNFTD